MDASYHRRTFTAEDAVDLALDESEFELCTFTGCDFSRRTAMNAVFRDCRFEHCNFAMVKLGVAVLRDAVFVGCKLTGVDFSADGDFTSFSFTDCLLDYAIFHRLKIKRTQFVRCSLTEADFSGADLTSAHFAECDLAGALFDQTNLEKADLRTAHSFAIDPERNRLRKAQFSLFGVTGLLAKYGIVVE